MESLYLEVFEVQEDRISAPPETLLCLLTIHFLNSISEFNIILIESNTTKTNDKSKLLWIRTTEFKLSIIDLNSAPEIVTYCQLPVFGLGDGISFIAGVCAVLRQMVKASDPKWHKLLGFREACLVATAEFSMWTKFCEVDLLQKLKLILSGDNDHGDALPVELARLEVHMSQPIRVHQIRKLKSTEHKFVEGPEFLLSDVIIAVPVFLILSLLDSWDSPHLPLIFKWFETVKCDFGLQDSLQMLEVPQFFKKSRDLVLPQVSNHSLYKSDPKRYKPRNKIFVQQCDIDKGLSKLSSIQMKTYETPIGHDIDLKFGQILEPDVPIARLERKIQQLVNLGKAVLKISHPKDIIVDFCAGSGNLGLIIAHCLPECKVLLVDNKEKSLNRGREKLALLGLKNVYIVQSNLDYFTAGFQVGVSLHACGVASDLVIQKCLMNKANFVVCPCCYGSIQSNHIVEYPQSIEVKNAGLSGRDLIVLGHCADQAGTEQGERGMLAVDTDRCLAAQARGYTVSLSKLNPPTCTPKNNLIVAYL